MFGPTSHYLPLPPFFFSASIGGLMEVIANPRFFGIESLRYWAFVLKKRISIFFNFLLFERPILETATFSLQKYALPLYFSVIQMHTIFLGISEDTRSVNVQLDKKDRFLFMRVRKAGSAVTIYTFEDHQSTMRYPPSVNMHTHYCILCIRTSLCRKHGTRETSGNEKLGPFTTM